MAEQILKNNFRGLVLDDLGYLVFGIDNGKKNLSSYKDPDGDSDGVFLLTSQRVGGKIYPVFSSHSDDILTSTNEGLGGMISLYKKSNFVMESKVVEQNDHSGNFKFRDEYLNRLYVGRPLILENINTMLIRKNNTGTSSEPPVGIEDTDVRKRLFPICYDMSTTTDSLGLNDVTIDTANYTSSNPKSLIPGSSYGLISNGTTKEYIQVNYYDPVSEKLDVTRGVFGTDPSIWSGSYSISFFNRVHLDNFDSVSDDILEGLDIYLVPHSKNGWYRSYRTVYDSYDRASYNQVTPVRSFDHKGNKVFRHPHQIDNLLFLNKKLPNEVSENTVGNYVLKESDNYSNKVFTNPYESDIGYIYDYCDRNEMCGNCMGNTPDDSDNCTVEPTAYDPDSDVPPMTYGTDIGSENKNWNSRNKLQNHTVPIALCAGFGFFVLVMFIVYVALMGEFKKKVGDNKYVNHDFTSEQKTVKSVTLWMTIISILVFIGAIVWVVMSIIEGRKTGGKRFFPATNYNRSIYNPPPGYTFINAPSQKNK